MLVEISIKMVEEIKDVIISSRNKITYEINNAMVQAYWHVGKIIVENEQNGNIKAEYGKRSNEEFIKRIKKIFRYWIFCF